VTLLAGLGGGDRVGWDLEESMHGVEEEIGSELASSRRKPWA